jgi:hypothetical protein
VEQLELLVWMSTLKNLKLVMHCLLNNSLSYQPLNHIFCGMVMVLRLTYWESIHGNNLGHVHKLFSTYFRKLFKVAYENNL